MEKQFTMSNTERHDQAELDQMNNEFEKLMEGWSKNDPNYLDHVKNMADRVSNNH